MDELHMFILKRCTLKIFIVCLVNLIQVNAVMIRKAPTNVTVLAGGDAKFYCSVVEQRSTDLVFWKKVSPSGFVDVLTYNGNSANETKYSVQGTYTLTVHNVVLEDETWYECQAGVDRAKAMLTVNVRMANMTLTWGTDPPFIEEMLVNLTCHVMHSRPPADVKWYHGQAELTTLASTCQKSSSEDGFGDTTSTMTVVIDPEDVDNEPYRCVASLPNSDVKRTEVVFVSKLARSTSGCFSLSSPNTYQIFVLSSIVVFIILS